MSFLQRNIRTAPLGYTTPSFPSLYWPIPVAGPQANFLYNIGDVWRFTLLWTLIFYAAVHAAVCFWAIAIQKRNYKVIWTVPIIYAVIGGVEALIAGSVTGGLIGTVYQAGYYRVSTWIPFAWALVCTLVLILSSFGFQGGL
ncbi:hypothetical protein EJ05DRAFT_496087 [Pseudovirgaria hyperparasitica]|uniref:Integral membrane protein n=1 Tax=Pseudovirgaria hyperparasitica TaxID=470096 RepID=A0A6A6WM18_9PEZI|nr:uncharacterized protein EJ05DRAFT_496087 [Pseudovirgaria hyperparasitica]KAF2763257.1 hypothetical protein EJ05DRAFT_496087 [Pseudovirgaria hyperparasitica]